MNSMTSHQPPRRARHARVSTQAWDEFDAPRRDRSRTHRAAAGHTRAAVAHAHLTFAESPGLYLREEMA
jgi:hypothetical protein